MDAGVGHQVGLELRNIHVQSTIEAQRGGQRRHDLSDQTVQVGVGGSLDVKVAAAHIVQGLVIQTESAVGVLQQGVRRQHVVVGFHDRGGDLRSRGHGERQLGLAAVVNGQTLQQQGTKAGASSTTSGVEDQETLKTSAVIGQLAKAVKHKVTDMLMLVRGTRAATYYAAMALDADAPDASKAAAVAKSFTSDAMSHIKKRRKK